jgi:hypothetical protein
MSFQNSLMGDGIESFIEPFTFRISQNDAWLGGPLGNFQMFFFLRDYLTDGLSNMQPPTNNE